MTTFKQGDDLRVKCLVTIDTLPVDISSATEIRASLFVDQTEVMKLSLTAQPGYGSIDVPVVTDKNELDLLITREYSKTFPAGAVTAYVDIFTPDADFGTKHTEYMFEIGTVEVGVMKNEEIVLTDSVTIEPFATLTSTRSGGVDTVSYTTTAAHSDSLKYHLDAASIGGGNVIDEDTGEVTYASDWTGVTVVMAVATGWNGPVYAYHVVTTT